MKKSISNPVTLISNLDLHLDGEPDGDLYCHCTLRLGSDQYSFGEHDYTVTLSKVMLHVDLTGYEMIPGTKFGENRMESVFVRGSVTETQDLTSYGFGANLDATAAAGLENVKPPEVSGGVNASYNRKHQENRTVKTELTQRVHRVLSRGDNYWDISDVDDNGQPIPLRDATYLHNDQLCGLSPVEGANRAVVTGMVMVRKADVEFKKNGFDIPFGRTKNKEKIMKTLTSEAIAGVAGSEFSINGFAALSIVEVTDEET